MSFVLIVVLLAAIVWGAVYAYRGSLLVAACAVIPIGYVLGHPFWNAQAGPFPVTLDRVALLAVLATLVAQWRLGRVRLRQFTAADWMVVAVVSIATASAVVSGSPHGLGEVTSKWGRLLTSFLIPATLYCVLRTVTISTREWAQILLGLALLGVYLATTAFLEVAGVWSLVFPRHIADPQLGTHFGRARGPELNAVSLGIYLTAMLWCTWTLAWFAGKRWQQMLLLSTLPLMAFGILVTFTRSTWLGLAASAMVVALLELPHRWRKPALGAAALGVSLLVAGYGSQLVGLKREGSAAESAHSVSQRQSFAYVSWQMFQDYPIFGVGFGRFYDRKLPYLSDRSQDFELESLRYLHHHNTLLSFLTETGLFGMAAFASMLLVWARAAIGLTRSLQPGHWQWRAGVLMLALLTSYLCSALFHDLTLIPSQQVLLFAFAGIVVNLRQAIGAESVQKTSHARAVAPSFNLPKVGRIVKLFGMRIHRITMSDAVNDILDWARQPRGLRCRYIVTPNVDHVVMYQGRADVRAAYANASLVLADGAPVVLASRLLGDALPERVAGSDLVPELFKAAPFPLRVFLLGAAPGVASKAAQRIENLWANVKVVGTYSPPLGFERDDAENRRILSAIRRTQPDLLIIGFGAPKQELWVHRYHAQLDAKVALCVGATIDFLAGHRRRSPVWMRRIGLEWLHRVCCEPRRLAARYSRDAWLFPQLVWHEWRRHFWQRVRAGSPIGA